MCALIPYLQVIKPKKVFNQIQAFPFFIVRGRLDESKFVIFSELNYPLFYFNWSLIIFPVAVLGSES